MHHRDHDRMASARPRRHGRSVFVSHRCVQCVHFDTTSRDDPSSNLEHGAMMEGICCAIHDVLTATINLNAEKWRGNSKIRLFSGEMRTKFVSIGRQFDRIAGIPTLFDVIH